MSRSFFAPRLIVLGFAILILVGTILLKLPASIHGSIYWVDAFSFLLARPALPGLHLSRFRKLLRLSGSWS